MRFRYRHNKVLFLAEKFVDQKDTLGSPLVCPWVSNVEQWSKTTNWAWVIVLKLLKKISTPYVQSVSIWMQLRGKGFQILTIKGDRGAQKPTGRSQHHKTSGGGCCIPPRPAGRHDTLQIDSVTACRHWWNMTDLVDFDGFCRSPGGCRANIKWITGQEGYTRV